MGAQWYDVFSNWLESKAVAIDGHGSVWIASDYSDANDQQQTFSFLFVAPDQCNTWQAERQRLRERTGERISWNSLKGSPDRKQTAFVSLIKELPGVLVTVSMRQNDVSDVPTRARLNELIAVGKLKAHWGSQVLWRSAAISQLLTRSTAALVSPHARVTWASDVDPAFQTIDHVRDALRIAFVTMTEERKRQFTQAVLHFTSGDDGSMLLEDLCSVPDLAVGLFHEHVKSLDSGGRLGRRELVSDWAAQGSGTLAKVFLSIEVDEGGRFVARDFHWNDVWSG